MAIPNTTPTPNIIFNGLMAKMTDTEFRVVMAVVRATLGWELDNETGMRRQEDWLSYWQLKKKTGRGYTALVQAIESCIKKGWIEARGEKGEILDTKRKRIGKKIFYRLGPEILLKNDENGIVVKTIQPFQKVKRLAPTFSESEISESEISESEAYKRNTITKEKHSQKDSVASKRSNSSHLEVKELFDYYKQEFIKKISDDAPVFNWGQCEKLAKPHLKQLGLEKMKRLVDKYLSSKNKFYRNEKKYSLSFFLSANTIHELQY